MASRKKQSEAMALLVSNYNDEEEDEDMEDIEQDKEEEEEYDEYQERREQREYDDYGELRRGSEDSSMVDMDRMVAGDSGNDDSAPPNAGDNENLTPNEGQFRHSTPQLRQTVPSDSLNRSRRGALTIVDYGHDEVAMSPEPEEGEIEGNGRVRFGADLLSANGDFHDKTPPGTVHILTPLDQATPQLSEPSQSDTMHDAALESEGIDAEQAVAEEQKDVDPLDKFLPPPAKAKCSEELQRRINKFLELKRSGKSFNAGLRNKKDYRNPDFLLHAVRYQDIDQIGSCFSKDVFDPHGFDKSDYYDEIEAEMRREMERKDQERKRSQKIEYVSGGTQPGIVGAAPKINVPVPGVSTMAASGLNSLPPAPDVMPRDGRQNKKSKWDKVDGDRKNPLPSGVQDSMSTVGTHATLLSSGAGYMAFAQQRRREVEEKRSSERKLDRRS
ncbi:PREDICTED: SAP30-binding [Prunus dulcis]|uniref:PREDICTED: SAP30-binding n=1 Tax=Prunus dulcis TaxID=3755 RepID=A0A5E4G633_PRUDU|nr:uncharacterized protein LOC117623987 [Prunus dulcis]VVA35271.1 PREDICTED: SAP30-binding [Prunus dulcis]